MEATSRATAALAWMRTEKNKLKYVGYELLADEIKQVRLPKDEGNCSFKIAAP